MKGTLMPASAHSLKTVKIPKLETGEVGIIALELETPKQTGKLFREQNSSINKVLKKNSDQGGTQNSYSLTSP